VFSGLSRVSLHGGSTLIPIWNILFNRFINVGFLHHIDFSLLLNSATHYTSWLTAYQFQNMLGFSARPSVGTHIIVSKKMHVQGDSRKYRAKLKSVSVLQFLPVMPDLPVKSIGYGLDGRGVRVRLPVGSRMFASPYSLDCLWCPPSLLSSGYQWLFSPG
jgi:hypothetical protein